MSCVAFSPDGKLLASTSWDRTIKISDPKTGELVRSIEAEKPNEMTLQEDGWTWIWTIGEGMNLIQLYGRLAWINLQLLELL